jgi:hypothetical protein
MVVKKADHWALRLVEHWVATMAEQLGEHLAAGRAVPSAAAMAEQKADRWAAM